MSSVVDGRLPSNYLWYYPELLQNIAQMNETVSLHCERLFMVIQLSKDTPNEKMRRSSVISQARLELCQIILDFISCTVRLFESNDFHTRGTHELYLLTYTFNNGDDHSMGFLRKVPYVAENVSQKLSAGCDLEQASLSENSSSDGGLLCGSGNIEDEGRIKQNISEHILGDVDIPIIPGFGNNTYNDDRINIGIFDVNTGKENVNSSPQGSLLELQLESLTLESLPESEPSFLSVAPEPLAVSLGSLNLQGPSEQVSSIILVIQSEIHPVTDICPLSRGTLLCSPIGLWFCRGSSRRDAVKVSKWWTYSVCALYEGEEAFAVGGADDRVRKIDLRMGSPMEAGGGFLVRGGRRLRYISLSASGLLAVGDGDAKRVTVHQQSGEQLYELQQKALGGQPWGVAWSSDQTLAVTVGGSTEHKWIGCFEFPEGKRRWRSEVIADMGWISYWADRLYVAVVGSPSLQVLQADTGQELPGIRCEGDQAVRVVDRVGVMTTVSYNRNEEQ